MVTLFRLDRLGCSKRGNPRCVARKRSAARSDRPPSWTDSRPWRGAIRDRESAGPNVVNWGF